MSPWVTILRGVMSRQRKDGSKFEMEDENSAFVSWRRSVGAGLEEARLRNMAATCVLYV